jgi:heme-degrading monooxygenase HmoA
LHTVSFVFKPGVYDDVFHKIDSEIEAYAESLEGFIGVERWVNGDGDIRNSVYYWRDMEAIKVFSRFEQHIDAKRRYKAWYQGYHIVISEIVSNYGDGGVASLATSK